MNNLQIRPLTSKDQDVVWQMLQHAAHEKSVEAVKCNPDLRLYAEGFSKREGDVGVVACLDNEVVGAAWVRDLGVQGYAQAYLSSDTNADLPPELAIGKGVGSAMLHALLQSAREYGHSGVCLSCRQDNPAMKLYERVGFAAIPGSEQTNRVQTKSVTMQCLLE